MFDLEWRVMKTPWMNHKKMQEIISKQKNCICSSKVYIRSISPERCSRQIYIMNSSGVQVKFINQCLIRKNIEDLEKRIGQISSVNTGVDQKAKQAEEIHKDAITDLPEVQIDVVEEASSESITISNQDLMKEMESSSSEESSVDYEDNQEFISYSEENQLSYVNLIEETEEDAAITDIPQLQSDVVEEASSESITISNQDLMKEMESSSSEESSVDYEDNQEFISYSEENQLSYVNLIEETEEDAAITDIPQLQSDVVEEASSESITISNQDLMKEMESSSSEESSVDYEDNQEFISYSEENQLSYVNLIEETEEDAAITDIPQLQSDVEEEEVVSQ